MLMLSNNGVHNPFISRVSLYIPSKEGRFKNPRSPKFQDPDMVGKVHFIG